MEMSETGFVFRMIRHPKELQEFQSVCEAIQPIMVNPQETREKKRQTLNMMVNELTEGAFKLKPIIEQIMFIINMKEDVCREYSDSESQVDGILEWLPRMRKHRGILVKIVKEHRGKYGLKI